MFILPLISVVLCYVIACIIQKENDIQDRLLGAIVSISINILIVYVSNEIFSLKNLINYNSIVFLWSSVIFIDLLVIFLIWKKENPVFFPIVSCLKLTRVKLLSIQTISVIVVISAFLFATFTVPYNWDSMSYHLSRIVHWTEYGSISHYACHDLSQITDPALAEFINLQIYVLSGEKDYFVNLLQTFSYLFSALLVNGICTKIGCRKLFQELAVLVYVTTPIIFGEALTTQVDVFAGIWLLIFAYIMLDFVNNEPLLWNRQVQFKVFFMGLATGFAYLAKASSMIGICILAFFLVHHCMRKSTKVLVILQATVEVVVSAFIIVIPELLRMKYTFHAILPKEVGGFLVPKFTLRYIGLNLFENIAYNLPIGIQVVDNFLDEFTHKVVDKLLLWGFGSTDKPELLFNWELATPITNMSHDRAISPLIIWLMLGILLAGAIHVFVWIVRCILEKRILKLILLKGKQNYIIWSFVIILFFYTVVKWYKFVPRYGVGYLALILPAIMLGIQILTEKRKVLVYIFSGFIIIFSLMNYGRLVNHHREYLYSGNRYEDYFQVKNQYSMYRETADKILEAGYKDIGFICSADSYEYPLYCMLQEQIDNFNHVCVENETKIFEDKLFVPECIITVDVDKGSTINYLEKEYIVCSDINGMRIYIIGE